MGFWVAASAIGIVFAGCTARQVKDTDCRCAEAKQIVPVTRDAAPVDAVVVPVGSPPFAMFGGDARHTGRRAGPAPAKPPIEAWSVDVHGAVAGSPTLGPDGAIYVASHDGALYAIEPTGKARWRFATKDRSWSTPAVAEDGTVYVGSDDHALYAIGADGAVTEIVSVPVKRVDGRDDLTDDVHGCGEIERRLPLRR